MGRSPMRILACVVLVHALMFPTASAWDISDDIFDNSLDDDATINTLAHNNEEQYAKSFAAEKKLDGTLLDDDMEVGGGRLEKEISRTMEDLRRSKDLDTDAKRKAVRTKYLEEQGLGDTLGDSDMLKLDNKPNQDSRTYNNFKQTQRFLDGDLGDDATEASELGESSTMQKKTRINPQLGQASPRQKGDEAKAHSNPIVQRPRVHMKHGVAAGVKKTGVESSGDATCTGDTCSGSSTIKPTPPPPSTPPPPPPSPSAN